MAWMRLTLIWMLLWQGLLPGGLPISQAVVHDPARCSCVSDESGCCGDAGACRGVAGSACCGGGERCDCGCMVPVRRESEEQTPRMVVRVDVVVAPTAERRWVVVSDEVDGDWWSVRTSTGCSLYAGVRRHMGVCIWRE